MFPSKTQLPGRYDLANRTLIGRGGMGVVYKVYDFQLNKNAALKTLRDAPSRKSLRMFERERDALITLNHANIVDIYDIGELEEEGIKKPFFVMTLLEGMPLDKVIRSANQRLTVERVVGILGDICKGLQAAHHKGVIHRDLKPSNIFVMEDDSVKIIDFGLAHMLEAQLTQGGMGTPYYMSPEQIERKELTAATDIFSLGVVAYEMFSLKRPFEKPSVDELARAILYENPKPLWQLNPGVNQAISQVVQRALAKPPQYRYAAASEFAEKLRMAFRNEPIAAFDASTIRSRLEHARAAFEKRDYGFAGEILDELATEGRIDSEVFALRELVNRAVRQEKIQDLMAAARRGLDEDEFTLASQKVREALQLDPENASALGLKHSIDDAKNEKLVAEALLTARGHIDNLEFDAAGEALKRVLDLKPEDAEAHQLLSDLRLRQEELAKLREQKLKLYDAARSAWQNGDLDAAVAKLEEVLRLDQRAPEPDRSAPYLSFYEQLRSERDELGSARANAAARLDRGEFKEALAECTDCLARYPNSVPLQVLKFEIEEQARRALTKYTADINSRLEREPDLEKRLAILREAVKRYPEEAHFEDALKGLERRRELVNGIVAKARLYENRAQWADAVTQWETLQTVHPGYSNLEAEIQRVTERRNEQARLELRSRTLAQIRRFLDRAEYEPAAALARDAESGGFSGDAEIRELARQAEEASERARQAEMSLAQARGLCQAKRFDEAIAVLQESFCLDESNLRLRTALSDAWVQKATMVIDTDWRAAEPPTREALRADPEHAMAKSLLAMISSRKEQEFRDQCAARAHQLRRDGDLSAAIAEIDHTLSLAPHDTKLTKLRKELAEERAEEERVKLRARDISRLRGLADECNTLDSPTVGEHLYEEAKSIAARHAGDPEVQSLAAAIGRQLEELRFAAASDAALAAPGGPFSGPAKTESTRLLETSAAAQPNFEKETEVPAHGPSSMLLTPPPARDAPGDTPTTALDVVLEPGARNANAETEPKPSRRSFNRRIKFGIGAAAVVAIAALIYAFARDSHNAPPVVTQTLKPQVLSLPAVTARPVVAPPSGVVAGRVRDSLGRPLALAGVVVVDSAGKVVANSRCDRRGRFQIAALAAGPYVVEVKAPEGYREKVSRSVVLAAGERADLSLRFKKSDLIVSKAAAPAKPIISQPPETRGSPLAQRRLAPAPPATPPSSASVNPGPPKFVNPQAVIDFVTNPPTSSEVFVDGIARGRGPGAVEAALSLGSHLLEVRTPPGWQPVRSTVRLMKATAATMTISLVRSGGGTLGISTAPRGASVYLDGVLQTRTTPVEIYVSPGHHVITLSKPGCAPVRGEVDLEPGKAFNFGRQLQCR